jgi:hypothetical protein
MEAECRWFESTRAYFIQCSISNVKCTILIKNTFALSGTNLEAECRWFESTRAYKLETRCITCIGFFIILKTNLKTIRLNREQPWKLNVGGSNPPGHTSSQCSITNVKCSILKEYHYSMFNYKC